MFPIFVLVNGVEACSLERLPKPLMLHTDVDVTEEADVLELAISMSSLFPLQDSVLK